MDFEEPPLGTPFAALATTPHVLYDEMLTAIEREFRAVDRRRLADALDQSAWPLLGLRAAPAHERAHALAEAASAALPDDCDEPPGWLLAAALDAGAGTPALRAGLAVELGRRAGVSARPVRLRDRWLVGVHDGGVPVGVDVGGDPGIDGLGARVGCLCAHQLGFIVLGGLAAAWEAAGRLERARSAAGLRLMLPLDDPLRSAVQDDLARYGWAE
jgi:hypothetical protein